MVFSSWIYLMKGSPLDVLSVNVQKRWSHCSINSKMVHGRGKPHIVLGCSFLQVSSEDLNSAPLPKLPKFHSSLLLECGTVCRTVLQFYLVKVPWLTLQSCIDCSFHIQEFLWLPIYYYTWITFLLTSTKVTPLYGVRIILKMLLQHSESRWWTPNQWVFVFTNGGVGSLKKNSLFWDSLCEFYLFSDMRPFFFDLRTCKMKLSLCFKKGQNFDKYLVVKRKKDLMKGPFGP